MSWMVAFLVLSALIFFHELGHYAAARLMGVYVEVFSIGFGRKVASFHWLNTEWRIAVIPLGGYVKMKGQEDLDPTKTSTDADSYNSKTPLQRIVILLAGPAANFLLAFLLYLAIGFGGPQALSAVVGKVVENSPAALAGLKTNDRILEINGISVPTWEAMAQQIKDAKGTLDVKIERDHDIMYLHMTPKITETENMFKEKVQRKMIGIGASGVTHTLDLGLGDTIAYAADETYKASLLIFKGVQKLITGDIPASELGGVVSIVQITSDASKVGWMSLLFFSALISVNLGILNLLPIPALDGGHIMFNLYEMITRRIPSEAVLVNLTIAGWVLLLGLMSLGLYNDINRLMG